jgi:RNA polymerase sigma factor (sigma-70 family)
MGLDEAIKAVVTRQVPRSRVEDLTQETWLALLQRTDGGAKPIDLAAYVRPIARSRITRWIAKKRATQVTHLGDQAGQVAASERARSAAQIWLAEEAPKLFKSARGALRLSAGQERCLRALANGGGNSFRALARELNTQPHRMRSWVRQIANKARLLGAAVPATGT